MIQRLRWVALLATVAALLITAVSSAASKQPQTYHRYTLDRHGTVAGTTDLTGYARGYAMLPAKWKSHSRNGQTRMRFTVPGSCDAMVDVLINQVIDDADETAQERVQRTRPADGLFLYGEGTRGSTAAWRVIRVKEDTRLVRAIYTAPLAADWPGVPAGKRVWLEITATGKARNTSCHTGGMREAVGYELVQAFGAMSGVGYPDNR